MTPGINAAKKAKVAYKVHEYTHDPSNESYGLEAAKNHTTVYVSAGRRGLEIELSPNDLEKLVNGMFCEIGQS